MKFLDGIFDNKNIMPLNIYYNRGEYNEDDYIDIIYKDMDTGKKYVQTIVNPKIEVWITKPDYRNYTHIKNYIEKSKCSPVYVHYKNRFREVAKLLNVAQDEVKFSPYVFGLDVQVESFYLNHFLIEYNNDKPKKISLGYLDIENDIIQVDGFPEPGEAPINVVTFIDGSRMESYTLILKKDNIPKLNEDHRLYEYYHELKNEFWTGFNEFENNMDVYIKDWHESFDESFGDFHYNVLIFEKEIDLIISLFNIIKASDNDYIEIWNSPYDMQNLIQRPINLGYDSDTIIPDKRFGPRHVEFEEDTNPIAHKRKHICKTYTMPTFIDAMVNYAGIRSGKGKLASLRLNSIAKKELKDEKIDHSEEGNIKVFAYKDFIKFIKYNVKDVLILFGLEKKTKDIDTFYTTIYRNSVLPNQVFTSTAIISESLRVFLYNFNGGYVMGSNKSRLFGKNTGVDYDKIVHAAFNEFANDDEYDLDDLEDEDEKSEDDDEEKKFKGAYVMNPKHMSSTGFKLLGKLAQFIHTHVVDFDITSEYPTAIIIMNASNETMVGKVFFENPEDIIIAIYPEFNFVDKEREKYSMDPGNFLLEIYSQGDVLNLGEIFLNLPSIEDVIIEVDKKVIQLLK